MHNWEFEDDDYWWDIGRYALRFAGQLNGIRYVFAVSQQALSDHFVTEDSEEQAIRNFLSNADWIRSIAISHANDTSPNAMCPHYVINSEVINKYSQVVSLA